MATTYPFWAARFSLLCVSLEVLPRRQDGTTAGCYFILPTSLRVPHPGKVFAHTQVRDPRESAAACLGPALGTPSSWPSHFPPGLSLLVEYHFVSDPGPRNDQRPAGHLFCKWRHKCGISNTFRFIVFNSPYDVIEHRHEDDSSLEFFRFAHFAHELLDFTDKLQ